jgi:N-acetylmuramoyl-L-alanine amidase
MKKRRGIVKKVLLSTLLATALFTTANHADAQSLTGVATLKTNVNLRAEAKPTAHILRVLPKGSKWKVSQLVNGMYSLGGNQWITTNSAYVSFSSSLLTQRSINGSLKGKVIVVDPGHGDDRPGAVANGIVEKNVTLDVAKRVKDKLEAQGATVYLTRNGDTDCAPGASIETDLACRPALATKKHADIFVSIHVNSADASAKGAETYYYKNSDKPLANAIQQHYVKETGLKDRHVRQDSFSVIRHATVPGVLIELGFLTNSSDAVKLKSNTSKDQMAQGITDGIIDYFN